MFILHYSLGFPPYRTGGLTKFCIDLMRQQITDGHQVALLWPGEMRILLRSVKIQSRSDVEGIKSYEIINPAPISYDEGIKDFDRFMDSGDINVYKGFLTRCMPDVIHVHTLMGLHKSFLEAARVLGIRLVFTTHDFFPICPKVYLCRSGAACDSIENCEKCGVCNNTALSLKKITVLQSPLYRRLKDSNLVKKLRKRHRDNYLGSDDNDSGESVGSPRDYLTLRNHYYSMLQDIDVIHYNSELTKSIYERVFEFPDSVIIGITHSDIEDHKRVRSYESKKIRIRYLGPQSRSKGYYVLKEALDKLWENNKDFVLDVHFIPNDTSDYMVSHNRYSYDQLVSIFNDTDILVCPSVGYDTFGYTVLEALSYGIPVIISDHVGAECILGTDCGIVYEALDVDALVNVFESLNNERLLKLNLAICDHQEIKTIDILANELYDLYTG